ncbi:expressed unknown protein [Seminavis robusta]|uniref:MYND-type domain-containing protein n=1 Tax=Seminavis robusta TaxID=568900 RepID=A0A9N8ETG8_9STRA|nr:expressed unknown protein [Seminavis robusta]|eukprot:Sro1826_g300110.1 n/a (302) ;mRNA; f:7712-8617
MFAAADGCYTAKGCIKSGDFKGAARALAEALRQDWIEANKCVAGTFLDDMAALESEMIALYNNVFQAKGLRFDALFVHVFILMYRDDIEEANKLINLAKCEVPEDPDILWIQCIVKNLLGCPGKAADSIRQAQAQNEWCSMTMYCLMIQAKRLEFSENCSQEEVADELFDEIVQQAEKDSEHYARVCYCVALRYALCGPRYMGKAKRFLDAAEQADRDRLPIFEDKDVSSLRTFAKDLIGKYEPCGNPDCADHALWDCDCCFQVSYCSKECQRKHWDQHHQCCNFAPCKRTKKRPTTWPEG